VLEIARRLIASIMTMLVIFSSSSAFAKTCTRGCPCGETCISCGDTCHVGGGGTGGEAEIGERKTPTLAIALWSGAVVSLLVALLTTDAFQPGGLCSGVDPNDVCGWKVAFWTSVVAGVAFAVGGLIAFEAELGGGSAGEAPPLGLTVVEF
jgi:hypothetical protein